MDPARKELHLANVEKHKDLALNAFRFLWDNPETGFKEWKAHKYMRDAFVKLGYEPVDAGNIPGFIANIDTGRPGPTVLIFGELDALIVESHPDADPKTGAVHACGHCCQAAGLLALAAALKEPGALDGLSGRIRLAAVPAEEIVEVEFREQLRKEGVIKYYGGKTEFMRRGLMDGVDIAMISHSTSKPSHTGRLLGGSNGCIIKKVTFTGLAAHAGSSPHKGINALYAANQGLSAINALRETFRDEDHIRVHPIISKGGESTNAVPADVKLESYVRGASMEVIKQANDKINRALAASAAAMGAGVTLCDRPGYFPRMHSRALMALARDAMLEFMTEVEYDPDGWGTGCTDIGDVSSVMPTVHPYIGGVSGKGHGDDYRIDDPESACLDMARVHALILEMLLKDNAARAEEIIADFKPHFKSIKEYLDFADIFILDREAVRYDGKGNVLLNLGPEELEF
ncbi:MAG: amidohydrolase [Firmicutes bacterium]|nr:amidohydrolase [Bacillota bacterium]